jgi:hypothetical protein
MADAGDAALELRAGDLSATLEGGALRWIRWRGVEVLRGLELTVRNATWATLEPRVRRREVTGPDTEGRIKVALDLSYRLEEVDFDVEATVSLSPSGELSLEMKGVARRSFERNRIGIICLHPMTVAGRQATFRLPDGDQRAAFPMTIDPRPVATDLVGIEWRPAAGIAAQLSLSGERWEMEDQRNWTDASFKTYPTPLRIPYPVRIAKGEVIDQTATLSVRGVSRTSRSGRQASSEIALGSTTRPFPRIESELAPDLPIDGVPTEALRALRLAGLRGLVDLEDDARRWTAADLGAVASEIGAPPVFDIIAAPGALARDVGTLDGVAPADVVFVFDRARGGVDSSDSALRSARDALRSRKPGIRIGGGTRGNFAEFNRLSFDAALTDAVTYAMNPQVHAFDEASIVETLPALPVTVHDARRRTRRPISPVLSLRPRFNAAIALGKDRPVHADPARPDPRQGGLFAAAWMLGAIARLNLPGVEAISVAETHGPAGLVQTDEGTARYRFTPLGALVASLGAARGRLARAVATPGEIAAIAISESDSITLWAANLRPRATTVRLPGRTIRDVASLGPMAVASMADAWIERRASVNLELQPWEVLRVRLANPAHGDFRTERV